MIVSRDVQNEVLVVGLQGSLDVSIQSEFKDELSKLAKEGDNDLILNFSEVSFIDSSCLGVLVSMSKALREDKGDIKLVGLSDDVRSIFQITRLDRVFEIFKELDTAVNAFYR
jgi:anti-sigma B factor antagonist